MGFATAYNSGAISTKAYNATLAKTRPQKSKMAAFNASKKDEAGVRDKGHLKATEINSKDKQSKTAPGVKAPVQMRGGKDRGGQPKTAHIDREQGPKFPAGQSIRKAGAGSNTRMRGPKIPSGRGPGLMGSGNSRSNSSY